MKKTPTISKPNLEFSYEDGMYTLSLDFGDKGSLVTDGKNLDELMKNLDEACKCHFHQDGELNIDLTIPMMRFSYSQTKHATSV